MNKKEKIYKGETQLERFYDYVIDTIEGEMVWFEKDKSEIEQAVLEMKNDKGVQIHRFKKWEKEKVMDKKDWRGQLDDLLTEYHSRAYCEVEGFVYDDDDRSTDEIQKEITNLVQQEIDRAKEEERSKTLLELIAIFGEWEHPLTFDSNYVQKFLGEEINNLTK